MTFVTLAQAAAWVCTRDCETVTTIGNEPADMQLLVAKQQWTQSFVSVTRWKASLDNTLGKPGETAAENHFEFASFEQAWKGLTVAIWGGYLPIYVAQDGKFRPLRTAELQELELRIVNYGPAFLGLWNKKTETIAHTEPQCLLTNLEILWPGPVLPPTLAMTRAILSALMTATADGQMLKKDQAQELMQKLPGYGARRFEEAWRQLPSERKVGRGKRGPNRIAA